MTDVLNKLKKIADSEAKKRLLENFFSLSFLQAANYILPLITLPYLVRVLGVEYFGLLAFATATVSYFGILTEYGFNLTATRDISIYRDDKEKVIEIFSSVMTIKFFLMFLSFLLMTTLVFSFEKFHQYWYIYFLTFGVVVGQTLFPVWFFQGMERMKYSTYLNVLAKLIFTIAIFIFVKHKEDFYIVPILTSFGFIFSGILSLIIIKTKFDIVFRKQYFKQIRYYFEESSKVFTGMFSYSLITTSTIFILGLFTSNIIVGYFSAVQRLIKGFSSLVTPISQSLYPYLANIYNKDKAHAFRLSLKATLIYFLFSLILLFILYFFPEPIITIIYSKVLLEEKVILLFKIFSFFPLLFGIVNIFCTQMLLIFKQFKIYRLILFFCFILNILLSYFLIIFYNEMGAAFSIIITELVIIITSVFFIIKLKMK
ncbi:MAG: flippase [Flavobacteriales bacterium]|nr:flippase [Flavobacteriales bacterium]